MQKKSTTGWEKILGLVYHYIQPQGSPDPDPAASTFGSVQLWGQGSLSVMKMGSECVLMYFLQFLQIIRYEKREKRK